MQTRTVARRHIASVVALAGVMIAGSAIMAAPAQAAASNCPSGYACLWEGTNYQTNGVGSQKVSFSRYIPNLASWNYSGTSINAANSASSVYNNGNVDNVHFYTGPNKTATQIVFAPKSGMADLNSWGASNNNLESGYFESYT